MRSGGTLLAVLAEGSKLSCATEPALPEAAVELAEAVADALLAATVDEAAMLEAFAVGTAAELAA